MENEYVQIGSKKYLRIKDKLVEIDRFDKNGKPVIKGVWSEETKHPDGRIDCTVHVPCLQIAGKPNKPT